MGETSAKQQVETNTGQQSLPKKTIIGIVGISLSAALALIASFTLANWAEAATLHHSFQHVLLFTAGLGMGVSLRTVIKRGN